MLRTYFLQNRDCFVNSDNPFSHFGEMDSEIAELRTMTKVTRLRKQIECREEGAWMVVKDIPDKSTPSGSRKVTAYGRTRRSVTRSVSSNAEFGNSFPGISSLQPLVQHPTEEEEEGNDSKRTSVEITEVFDEPLRVNVPQDIPQNIEKTNNKKTSVVTLGKGNLVLIDPEDESNFHVTGISKGKVADVVSTLERSYEKKPKKVGFCKTEVHFAPDSGKINIVETDEKPPPTQVYRKKKRSRGIRNKQSNCLPKHYFGEVTEFGDDSNLSESDREDSRPPLTFSHNIEVLPEVKQLFPTFERTIKSENKDVKYRYSSPEKNDSDLEIDKFHLDEKDFFRKLKQSSYRERFLKETEPLAEKKSSGVSKSLSEDIFEKSNLQIDGKNKILNGFLSGHHSADLHSKDTFINVSFGNKREEHDNASPPELKYTEFFKIPVINENKDQEYSQSNLYELKNESEISDFRNSEENNKSDYGYLNVNQPPADEKHEFTPSVSRVPIDQDLKTDISFLGSMSPKLKNLIKNSVEHEFQLRQKQILQKKSLEKKYTTIGDSNKIKSSVNINISTENKKEDKQNAQKDTKLKPSKCITQVKLENNNETKHEFQLKREQITKNLPSEPVYGEKEFEFKEMPYLLKEEPIPAPREKPQSKQKNEILSLEPPKPKPRTIVSVSSERNRCGKVSSRHSIKSESSSLSKRVRSRENLHRPKDRERIRSATPVKKEELKTRRSTALPRVEGSTQRLPKSNTQGRKMVRGEPLRSFEKVSNGWVGIVPTKQDDKMSPKVTVTTKVYSNKTLTQQSTQHISGTKKSTPSSTLRSSQSSRSEIGRGTKQFSLSKEHLTSAKLVREISPKKVAKPKSEVLKTTRSRTVSSKEGSFRRVRRDSNDSVVQADEEVRAYMFNSRTKVPNILQNIA